jgi:hypothetical protein
MRPHRLVPPGRSGTRAEQEASTSVASRLVHTRFALIGGAAAAAAVLVVARRRRRRSEPEPFPAADPADELRRKLDESRALDAERDEFEAGETPVDQAEPAGETVESRRRKVHDDARAAADEMTGRAPDAP